MTTGMAAAMAVVQALPPQSTILLPDNLYFNVVQALDLVFVPWGIKYRQVRGSNSSIGVRHHNVCNLNDV